MKSAHNVVIVGAGPTGLMLGCLLALKGIDFKILEKQKAVSNHSRSIGIHPPSISIFKEIGLLDRLLTEANKIDIGKAFVNGLEIGELNFSDLKHDFPFILTLSQSITESILEEKVLELAPNCINRGIHVKNIQRSRQNGFEIFLGDDTSINCNYLIGCDGKLSIVRKFAKIAFIGKRYSDTYIMGDYFDNIGDRNVAEVHLTRTGLVESFPHGQDLRRWVAKTHSAINKPEPEFLAQICANRTIKYPIYESCSMISSFGVERYLAESMYKNGVFLAGDSAHIVSPIGGQGMNLGWLDAFELSKTLSSPSTESFENYNKTRIAKAKIAGNRAFFNMFLGRARNSSLLQSIGVKLMLKQPFRSRLLKMFTMSGLE